MLHIALAESFNATLKREVLRDRKVFDNPIACRQEVFRWCMRYNTLIMRPIDAAKLRVEERVTGLSLLDDFGVELRTSRSLDEIVEGRKGPHSYVCWGAMWRYLLAAVGLLVGAVDSLAGAAVWSLSPMSEEDLAEATKTAAPASESTAPTSTPTAANK